MVIPDRVRELMWEYDPDALDALHELPDVVIERLMERGGVADMRWLIHTVGAHRLRRFLEARGRRVLPPRELRFWCWATRVDEDSADAWVERARTREASWRG